MKMNLAKTYIHTGVDYGPGEVEVPDEAAKDIKARIEAEEKKAVKAPVQPEAANPETSRTFHKPPEEQKPADPPASATLDSLTVPELKERAKEAGIDGYSGMNKAQLIEALQPK